MAFRKSMIGRGKPLTAREADSAIHGAQAVTATGPLVKVGKRSLRREHRPESPELRLTRVAWYIRAGLPLVIARENNYAFSDEELEAISVAGELECAIVMLRWDSEKVYRKEGYEEKFWRVLDGDPGST